MVFVPIVYFIKSPVCNNGEGNDIVFDTKLTSSEVNVTETDGSIIISGNTTYPSPGSITSTRNIESKFITTCSTAARLGSGYIVVSIYAITLGGSVYPRPLFNTNTAGKFIVIISPGICIDIGVPSIPRVNPLSVLFDRSTLEYPINSSPINIIPLIGKPYALSTAIAGEFNETYDANTVI